MKDQGQPLLRETRPGLQRLRIDVDDRGQPSFAQFGTRRTEQGSGAPSERPRFARFRNELGPVTSAEPQERCRAEDRSLDPFEAGTDLAEHLADPVRIGP